MVNPINWGADVPISMPQPLDDSNPALIPMDGFTFTWNGLAHDLSQADWEARAIPTFAPRQPTVETVRYDEGLDGPKGTEG